MPQSIFDRRLEIAKLASAVVALALEPVGLNRVVVEERGDSGCKLDLPTRAACDVLQALDDRTALQVTPDYRAIRGRVGRCVTVKAPACSVCARMCPDLSAYVINLYPTPWTVRRCLGSSPGAPSFLRI